MGLTTDGMSPADLAAVTGNNNGAFGEGNGAWWIIILFLFIFCGWGNGNGWNNGGGGVADNYVLASDFATLQRQIDSGISSLERKSDTINSGICDGFYAMNTSLLNGFAGTNSTIQQNGYDTRNAIQQEVTNGFCQTNFNNANNTRDIIDNQNNNARAILDALTAQRIEAKDAKIAEQNQQLFAAQLAASQASQNETLKAYMQGQFTYYNPRPVPAFPVSAPYQYGNCGCNAGCGC